MTRLLIVTELFFPSVGGQEIRYLEFGRTCVQNGWHVDVWTIGDRSSKAWLRIDGINVFRLARCDEYRRPGRPVPRALGAIVEFSLKVRRFLRKRAYDVVLFNLWPLLPQMISHVAPPGLAVVDWCEHRAGVFWYLINRRVARSATSHVCVSAELGRCLMDKYGLRNVHVMPSGIHLPAYHAEQAKSGILFLGRLVRHKRPKEVVEAVILARAHGFREHVTIAGAGPLLPAMRQTYGHLDFVRFTGDLSDEEKAELFAQHAVHVLPSEREGFPRTVAEAMASGTPTITTSHPGNGTCDVLRHTGAGIVVEPGAAAIAAAILRWNRDQADWRRYQEACLTGSKSLDWQKIFKDFMAYIEGRT